jgi:hypothetical protein
MSQNQVIKRLVRLHCHGSEREWLNDFEYRAPTSDFTKLPLEGDLGSNCPMTSLNILALRRRKVTMGASHSDSTREAKVSKRTRQISKCQLGWFKKEGQDHK